MVVHARTPRDRGWWSQPGPEQDVVIATRALLTRNLADRPFDHQLNDPGRLDVRRVIETALSGTDEEWYLADRETLSQTRFAAVCAQSLVDSDTPGPVLLDTGEERVISLGGADHLVLGAFVPGWDAGGARRRVELLDQSLEELVDFAVSLRFGYLSADIARAGTGLTVQALLHLPAVEAVGRVAAEESGEASESGKPATAGAPRAATVARSPAGETEGDGETLRLPASAAEGAALTLVTVRAQFGEDETATVARLEERVQRLVHYEREARRALILRHGDDVAESARRALGTLLHARRLAAEETRELASIVRLAAAAGLLGDGGQMQIAVATDVWFLSDDRIVAAIDPSDDRPLEARRATLVHRRVAEAPIAQEM